MNVFTTRFLHHVTSYILVKADISTQELSKTVQLKPKPPTGHMKTMNSIYCNKYAGCVLSYFFFHYLVLLWLRIPSQRWTCRSTAGCIGPSPSTAERTQTHTKRITSSRKPHPIWMKAKVLFGGGWGASCIFFLHVWNIPVTTSLIQPPHQQHYCSISALISY